MATQGHLVSVGGPIDETDASLLIYSQAIVPEEITKLLNCVPDRSHQKGDLNKSGIPTRSHLWWIKESGKQEPEILIQRLIDRVNLEKSVWEKITDKCEAKISCVLTLTDWTRGLELSPKLLSTLGDLKIGLGFSIYFIKD